MTNPSLVRIGCFRAKEYFLAVIAAWLMYGGVRQILGVLRFFITGLILNSINGVRLQARTLQAFRGRLPLANPYSPGPPWQYQAKAIAIGVVVIALGMFVGLWAHIRTQRKPT